MSMTLTADDLQAIKGIVDEAVEQSVVQTAAGFAEVHEKFDEVFTRLDAHDRRFEQIDERFEQVDRRFDGLESTVGRIEQVQRAEVGRADRHGEDLALLKRQLPAV